MSPADKWSVAGFFLGLVILAVWMLRQSYNRAHPKPRLPGPFTRWSDGR